MQRTLGSFLTDETYTLETMETIPVVRQYLDAQNPTLELSAEALAIQNCITNPTMTIEQMREDMSRRYIDFAQVFRETGWRTGFTTMCFNGIDSGQMVRLSDMRDDAIEETRNKNGELALVVKCCSIAVRIQELPETASPFDVYMCVGLDELQSMGW